MPDCKSNDRVWKILFRMGSFLAIGGLLWGCATVVPLYLDTGLDSAQQEAFVPTTTDSVQVDFISRIQATRFSPFDRGFRKDREGMLGISIPIQKALGALVEDYARHKFERLHGVTRHTLDSLVQPAFNVSPRGRCRESSLPSEGARIQIILFDFRIKEHSSGVVGAEERIASRKDTLMMAGRIDSTEGEERGLVRGARMWIGVRIRTQGTTSSTELTASVEQQFEKRTSARWAPVVDALNDKMMTNIDRYLEVQGM